MFVVHYYEYVAPLSKNEDAFVIIQYKDIP